MVKIRLQRLGNKGRPFYRVVVSKSEAGRNSAFVENIGIYNPISQPKEIRIDEERALHWLRNGAEPTETTAWLLNKLGILPKFLEERPNQKRKYKFLDKRTAAISKPSAVEARVESPKQEEAPVAVEAPAEVAAEESTATE
jgi:small subunit ribosomal protein S16